MLTIATIGDGQRLWEVGKSAKFVWYYADICDASGNGLVINWAQGLPFLPGSSLNNEHFNVPSLNIVVYRARRPISYLLHELRREDVDFDPKTGSGRLGRTVFVTSAESGVVRLSVDLDVELPGRERWRGSVEVEGRALELAARTGRGEGGAAQLDSVHIWRPQTVHARGTADLRSHSDVHRITGSAYFDANRGTVPLHEQGIARWDWGRVTFQEETLVFYFAVSDKGEDSFCVALLARADGKTEDLEADLEWSDVTISPYLVRTARALRVRTRRGDFTIRLARPLERGPFYERYWAHGRGPDGAEGVGFTEVVLPPRLDRAFLRPFVRMRTSSDVRPNSMWLPLFSGAPGRPLTRLLSTWAQRRSSGTEP